MISFAITYETRVFDNDFPLRPSGIYSQHCLSLFVCHFYRASICEGGLGSRNSVCPSVRLSVTRVDCDKSKWCTVDILIPHKRVITLLL